MAFYIFPRDCKDTLDAACVAENEQFLNDVLFFTRHFERPASTGRTADRLLKLYWAFVNTYFICRYILARILSYMRLNYFHFNYVLYLHTWRRTVGKGGRGAIKS